MLGETRGRDSAAWALWLVVLVGLAGCEQYPGADERWDDDIVATAFDEDTDFGDFETFAVDPVVRVVKDLDDGGLDPQELPDDVAEPIVAKLVENMEARGYTQVGVDDSPDLGLTITGYNSRVVGSAGGCWGYGWYWYWGCYYPYPVYYSYRTGSVVTELIDLTGPVPTLPEGGVLPADAGPPDGDLGVPVVWSSVAYQVLDSSGRPEQGWALDSIDQAFEQSPYLRRD